MGAGPSICHVSSLESLGPAPANRPRPSGRVRLRCGRLAELVPLCCGSARPSVSGPRPALPARHGAWPRRSLRLWPCCHLRGLVPRDVRPVAGPGPVAAGGAAATPSAFAVPGYPCLPQVGTTSGPPRVPGLLRRLAAQTTCCPPPREPAGTSALISAQPTLFLPDSCLAPFTSDVPEPSLPALSPAELSEVLVN